MKKITLIFGTRPEAIKLCPLVLELRKHPEFQPHVCLTGQHREMLDQVLGVFDVTAEADLNLMQPDQTLAEFTARAIAALDTYLADARPDLVLVQGDTTTTFCAALAAFYRQIPIGHVEAGLRTWNKFSPFPEEINRVMTSRMADLHFAPTARSKENLLAEGVRENRIFVTGNTVIDALHLAVEKIRKYPPEIPGVPWVSAPGESFFDTAVVNGTAYPTLTVDPTAYRLRILNASNDRFWNLQMYVASNIISGITVDNPGSGYSGTVLVTISGGGGKGATAEAVVDEATGTITGFNMLTVGSGYTSVPTVTVEGNGTNAAGTAVLYQAAPTEVGMVPATATAGFPTGWPTDGRVGGVPDPARRGPSWIQIGTEGGFLPQPAIVPNQPITWNMNPTTFNFGNVDLHGLLLGPAERADVVVDFSQYAGQTLIVYNDAPAAFPALDPRYDYYTASPDLTSSGGYGGTLPGFGPNTRTVMQIVVSGTIGANGTPYDLAGLQAEFLSTTGHEGVFQKSQNPIIVGQSAYDTTYNTTFPVSWPLWGLARIQDWSMQFKTVAGTTLNLPFQPKALHDEMGAAYDEYGRMSGKLGLELVGASALVQTFVLQNFVDPATEVVDDSITPLGPVQGDGTQIWKITHNGVDTHPIHFHLFDVQLINRVGWDGIIRRPDANELGWKDTIRVSPLEDTIVAVRATASRQPFGLPDSIRPLNPSQPISSPMGFSSFDPLTGNLLNPPTLNHEVNFGWEYVWHCHILSHEEMDMMRPIAFQVGRGLPGAPILSASRVGAQVNLTWIDATPAANPATLGDLSNEIGFRIERATVVGVVVGDYAQIGTALANQTTFVDSTADVGTSYRYRVYAYNVAGETVSNVANSESSLPPVISVATPNSAGPFAQGTVVPVTWNVTNPPVGGYFHIYAFDGAYHYLTSKPATGTNSYSANWTVTQPIGTGYVIRIWYVDAVGNWLVFGDSAPAFAISAGSPPSITVTAPNTAGPFTRGSVVPVTWDVVNSPVGGYFHVYAYDGTYHYLTSVAVTGAGSYTYNWTITQPVGSGYVIRIWYMDGGGSWQFFDDSAPAFAISAGSVFGITVTTPNSAGPFAQTDVVPVNWIVTNSPVGGYYHVYAFNGTYQYITSVPATGASSYNLNWTVAQPAGTGYVIRIWYMDTGGNWLLFDDSAPPFEVQ